MLCNQIVSNQISVNQVHVMQITANLKKNAITF